MDKLMTNSRITEVANASERMNLAYDRTALQTDTPLTKIFSDLGLQTERLTAALRRAKTESELETKNETRNNNLRSVYYLVTGYTHNPDALTKASAVTIKKNFDNYGLKIIKESYASESALITSLLVDFGNPACQQAIAALSGCALLIEALQRSQADFELTRVVWEKDKAKEGALENASTLKEVVVTIINERLVVYLRAMQEVSREMYGEFADTIAIIIAENNEQVKKRKKNPEPKVVPGQ